MCLNYFFKKTIFTVAIFCLNILFYCPCHLIDSYWDINLRAYFSTDPYSVSMWVCVLTRAGMNMHVFIPD